MQSLPKVFNFSCIILGHTGNWEVLSELGIASSSVFSLKGERNLQILLLIQISQDQIFAGDALLSHTDSGFGILMKQESLLPSTNPSVSFRTSNWEVFMHPSHPCQLHVSLQISLEKGLVQSYLLMQNRVNLSRGSAVMGQFKS